MPVPVPTRRPSHPVSKPIDSRAKQSALQHLLTSLPEPPAGCPAIFTDRETWIQSLPPSRRYKLRQETSDKLVYDYYRVSYFDKHSSQSFAFTISGDKLSATQTPSVPGHVRDSQRSYLATSMAKHAPLSNGKPWPPSPPDGTIEADEYRRLVATAQFAASNSYTVDDENEDWTEDEEFFAGPALQRPAPIKRRISPEGNVAGSDIVFGTCVSNAGVITHRDSEFMHRCTDIQADGGLSENRTRLATPPVSSTIYTKAPQADGIMAERKQTRKVLSPISTVVTPNDMTLYRRMVADPMSEWIAVYIWKVVTQGMSLPPEFVVQENKYG